MTKHRRSELHRQNRLHRHHPATISQIALTNSKVLTVVGQIVSGRSKYFVTSPIYNNGITEKEWYTLKDGRFVAFFSRLTPNQKKVLIAAIISVLIVAALTAAIIPPVYVFIIRPAPSECKSSFNHAPNFQYLFQFSFRFICECKRFSLLFIDLYWPRNALPFINCHFSFYFQWI